MGFVQIVEFTTDNIDKMREIGSKYEAESGLPGNTAALYKDRDKENTYVVIGSFPSYEKAMENSERPETQALAEEMGKLATGPASYRNLEEIQSWGG